MKWLTKICKVLENPKYKNIGDMFIDKNNKQEVIGACALGELLLSTNCRIGLNEMTSHAIRRSLRNYYRVPAKVLNGLFCTINHLNSMDKSKKQIAKILKKEYTLK